MADAKTINGYNLKDAAAREAIANLNTVKLASEGGASGSIRFGVDSNGKYGYYKAGADTVTPFSSGGDFEETVLWTNSSPTSDFSNNNITGLPNLSQYDYIGVYCNRNTSTATEIFVAMDYAHFKDTKWEANYAALGATWHGASAAYTRNFVYVSDTSIGVTNCYYYNTGSTAGTSNNTVIPTKIVGIKKGRAVYPKPIRVTSARDAQGFCHGEVHFDATDYTSVTFTVHVSGSTHFISSGGTRAPGTYTDDLTNVTDFWIGAYTYTNDYYSVITYIDSIEFS